VRYAEIICRGNLVQTTDARMEEKYPSQLNSWVKLHVPGLTQVAHEAVCTPSSMSSLFQKPRIKIYLSHHFAIIINYYLKDLSPLSYPLFQPFIPLSLT
jgi:hypothetical protein